MHPSYGAGHATVAGACITILKAWFDESFVIPAPVVASSDGSLLNPYAGTLTVGNELNKLASNISIGRDAPGMHWRTDGIEGLHLFSFNQVDITTAWQRRFSAVLPAGAH